MVGSYPKGCNWDMCYGKIDEEEQRQNVVNVKWLEKDPLYGVDGPALWDVQKLEKHKGGDEKDEL